jgi:hypothetical protein
MFIPAQTPDLHQPLTQLLEAKPVAPVSAVPGIPEDAQHLDSRVALQWAQPVLQAEKGQTARTALSVPLAVQIVKPLNIKGFESQGPDPDALLKGEVHPMLEEGLASWINYVLTKPSPNLRFNVSQPNTASTTETASGDEIKQTSQVKVEYANAEPDTTSTQVKLATKTTTASVLPILLNLYEALANSEIFAAQRLTEAWLPRRVKPHFDIQENLKTDRPQSNAASPSLSLKHTAPKVHAGEAQEALNALAQPIEEPSIAQLTKWVAALEPDSEHAQQAAQMLTQGQMVWQAELAPGIPMRLVREDAWRNQANKPAQLEKGATLKVEVELPNLGRIRIVGSQWGSDLSLQIAHAANAQDQWSSLMPSLMEELQASGISDVRLETLSNETEAPNG